MGSNGYSIGGSGGQTYSLDGHTFNFVRDWDSAGYEFALAVAKSAQRSSRFRAGRTR